MYFFNALYDFIEAIMLMILQLQQSTSVGNPTFPFFLPHLYMYFNVINGK